MNNTKKNKTTKKEDKRAAATKAFAAHDACPVCKGALAPDAVRCPEGARLFRVWNECWR